MPGSGCTACGQVYDGLSAYHGDLLCHACRDARMETEGVNILVVDDRPSIPSYHTGDCYLEITFPHAYSGIEIEPGRIRIPFMNVDSARQARREMRTDITHELTVVAGEVLSDPPAIQGSAEDTGDGRDAARQPDSD